MLIPCVCVGIAGKCLTLDGPGMEPVSLRKVVPSRMDASCSLMALGGKSKEHLLG